MNAVPKIRFLRVPGLSQPRPSRCLLRYYAGCRPVQRLQACRTYNQAWKQIACTTLVQCALVAINAVPTCVASIILSNPNEERVRPSSLLLEGFSTRSSTHSNMAGSSGFFPISNLRLATNHEREGTYFN